MERRYIIISVAPNMTFPTVATIKLDDTVTESELKRRLAIIAPIELTHDNGDPIVDDEDINILVNGYRRKE